MASCSSRDFHTYISTEGGGRTAILFKNKASVIGINSYSEAKKHLLYGPILKFNIE